MSLFVLPVDIDDIADLELGIQFFETSDANQTFIANQINAGLLTVDAYANQLLATNISTSQVAMAVGALGLGETPTIAQLTFWSTQFLPDQIAHAIAFGFEPTVYAAEALGLAMASTAEFQAQFGALNANDFALEVSGLTGVNAGAVLSFVNFWVGFYTQFPQVGLTALQAAKGAAFGEAVGVALLNPSISNVDELVKNALFNIAQGTYEEGIPIGELPLALPFQGAAPGLTLTINIDNLTAGFAGAVFEAPPGGNAPLGTTNTLNTGDTLLSTVGDATLNFTAVNNFLSNPAFATGVNMTGIATVNIQNLTSGIDPNVIAGFAGNITGLTTLRILEGSNPFGFVQAGLTGLGLNTALETLEINAGQITVDTTDHDDPFVFGGDVSIWIESDAFAGGEVLDVNLDGDGVGTFLTLNRTGGNNFYETVNVSSVGTGPNHLVVSTNADTIATVTVDGDQDLRICGEAFPDFGIRGLLDQDILTTFDASAATGDVTAFFEGENDGDVDVIGGTGDDDFWFLVTDPIDLNPPPLGQDEGETTFTATDSVDGGDGDNRLTLQAFEGALLGAGVGPNIVNITRIVHSTLFDPCLFSDDNCLFNPMQGNLTVNMARSGSATELELAGFYDFFDVSVTNLQNADTVIFSGVNINLLSLQHVSGAGTFNLVMAQDPCVEEFFGPLTHFISTLDTVSGAFLNIESTGNADENVIFNAHLIDTDIEAFGDVDLSIGGVVDFNGGGSFLGAAYDFDGGLVNATALEGDLFIATGFGNQRVFTGLGDDYVIVNSQIQGPNETFDNDLVDLSTGGSDTVQFDGAFFDSTFLLPGAVGAVFAYNVVLGFDVADDVIVQNANTMFWLDDTNGNDITPNTDPLIFFYSTGTIVDATGDDFNFIKIVDQTNTGNISAQDGFDQAMSALGSIDVNTTNWIAGSYYDATHTQAVLFNVLDFDGVVQNGLIEAGDVIAVVSVVDMTFAEYSAFDAGNLSFAPFV